MESYITGLTILSFAFIITSGVFALFISALDMCRKSRIEKEHGKYYKTLLNTLENPQGILLSSRLWINLLRILAAVFLGIIIYMLGVNITLIAVFGIILAVITTLLSDTLPKLLAHIKPEKTAVFLLPVMKIFSFPMLPFTMASLKFASFFKITFRPEIDNNSITEEELQDELRNTLIEGEKSGIVESKERTMVEGVFYLGDRPVGAFMTHRSEIQLFDINDPYEEICAKSLEYRNQQCFPVVNGSPDEIVGAVFLEDIIIGLTQNVSLPDSGKETSSPKALRAIMKKAQFVPETMPAIKAFESFKQSGSNFLFVMDEYGGLAGIISINALVEEIVGELSTPVANEDPIIKQQDGTWLADGIVNIDDAANALSLTGIDKEGGFHTLAGFILHLAGELPKVGDSYEYYGYKFKVVDKDGNRIDKVLITKIND
ncbi:MAG: hemolysin family protein [Treponema sp.]|nr:hemolysin family protein [Treponema sp.]